MKGEKSVEVLLRQICIKIVKIQERFIGLFIDSVYSFIKWIGSEELQSNEKSHYQTCNFDCYSFRIM